MTISFNHLPAKRDVVRTTVEAARIAADCGVKFAHAYLSDAKNQPQVECALRIRAVENALYELFGKGKLHGTIHTCIGQEFSGSILGKFLKQNDFVTSNHRCHGHFIGATGNWRGLIDEIVGNHKGVCAGIGSSQHLWAPNFMSNGQQGGLLPVAAGVALARKAGGSGDTVLSFLGEGTLGEGVVYETLNIDSLWELPHVIICENNFYSQSTEQERGVAGTIIDRAHGFGVSTISADTWDLPAFDAALAQCIERARVQSRPSFLVLTTYRLNPHSKGDDSRDQAEIEWFRRRDPASLAVQDYRHFATLYESFFAEAAEYAELALREPPLESTQYFIDQLPRPDTRGQTNWAPMTAPAGEDLRIAQQLNAFYLAWLERDRDAFFIGEDIKDPYGGAFKVAKGMTTAFPSRALATPISEAAITGIGIGLAITGRRAFVEMMFGDFITYAFDQIVNNASKMFHMYNRNLECPVVVRAPMGGRRGYGPTHSQSLERFLIGIDNCATLSLHSLMPVAGQLAGLADLRCPVILLENKSDYAARSFSVPDGFTIETDDAALPTLKLGPACTQPTVTIFAYGGMARFVANSLIQIFEQADAVPELIVPCCLSPLNLVPLAESLSRTGHLVVIEEGAGYGSVGAEAIAQLAEKPGLHFRVSRVSGKPTPIPSAPSLEAAALPSIDDVCAAIRHVTSGGL